MFYHIKNLQSTKTMNCVRPMPVCFITLRIYKVLKQNNTFVFLTLVLSH